MNYDDILQLLGGFGKYQKLLLLLITIPVCFDGITTMMLVFILGDHNYRCRLPDVQDDSFSTLSTAVEAYNVSIYNASQCYLTTNKTDIPCDDWVYDSSVYTSTLISKFNMVCQDKFMRSHVLLSHFVGTFFNAIFCGLASDRWGRKPVLIVGIFLLIVPNFIRPWMPNLLLVAMCEFLNAMGSNITYVVPFTIVTELVDPKHRVLASFSIYMSYCVGQYVLLIYAYFIRDWETLIIVIAAPITLSFFIFSFVTESPRWLLIKGRTKEAMRILNKIAHYNKLGVEFNPKDINTKEENRISILQELKIIVRSKRMITRFLILFFNWFSISFIYFGISMNTGDLGGDVYINYTISTTVETIAVFFCIFADKFPRKMLFCPAMIIGSCACLSTIFTSIYGGKSLHWLTITLAMVGKLGVTTAFFVIYLITLEVFPTAVRASMLGLCSTGARIGSMSSSYIGKLGVLIDSKFGVALPLIIFGSVGTAAGLLSLLLPETRNIELPDTFDDALHIESNLESRTVSNSSEDNSSEEKMEMISKDV